MGISRSESGEFSFRFWGFSIDKTQLASNAVVSSLFDRFHLSDARPSLDARSGTNVVGLIPHFYMGIAVRWLWPFSSGVNALSGLYLISTAIGSSCGFDRDFSVNALSGLYLISTFHKKFESEHVARSVNALSGLYLISTHYKCLQWGLYAFRCQCPLGLISHFYGTPSKT